mgnify:CR=1 FL=1
MLVWAKVWNQWMTREIGAPGYMQQRGGVLVLEVPPPLLLPRPLFVEVDGGSTVRAQGSRRRLVWGSTHRWCELAGAGIGFPLMVGPPTPSQQPLSMQSCPGGGAGGYCWRGSLGSFPGKPPWCHRTRGPAKRTPKGCSRDPSSGVLPSSGSKDHP